MFFNLFSDAAGFETLAWELQIQDHSRRRPPKKAGGRYKVKSKKRQSGDWRSQVTATARAQSGVAVPRNATWDDLRPTGKIACATQAGRYERCAGYSERRASITSMRAARAAGSTEATTAAASRTAAEAATGIASGMRMSTT